LNRKNKKLKKDDSDSQLKQKKILEKNLTCGKKSEAYAKEDFKNCGHTILNDNCIGYDFKSKSPSGEYWFVEVKSGNSKLSKRQKKMMKDVNKNGGNYFLYRVSHDELQYNKEQKEESLDDRL